MKLQRVNLLPKREKPKRDWLSLAMVGLYLGVGVGLMLIWMLWSLYSDYSTQTQLKAAQAHLAELQSRTADLQTELEGMKPDDGLLARQALLENRINVKKTLVGELVTVSRDSQAGFALPMLDLSSVMPEGVWLERLSLGNEEHQMVLNGFTQHPELLTDLVDKLVLTPRFTLFHVINMHSEKLEAGSFYTFELTGYIRFPASSNVGGQP